MKKDKRIYSNNLDAGGWVYVGRHKNKNKKRKILGRVTGQLKIVDLKNG